MATSCVFKNEKSTGGRAIIHKYLFILEGSYYEQIFRANMQKKWRKKGCVFFIDFLGGSFPNEKQHIALTLSGHMTVSRWDWLIVVLENNTITDAQESFSHKMDLKQR